MENKALLRRTVLARRNELSGEDRAVFSEAIVQRVLASQAVQNAETIFLYVSYQSEVGTDELITRLLKFGKKVAVPRMDGREMNFYRIQSMSELQIGYKGIREPLGAMEAVRPKKTDVMLLPGTVFDQNGGRMGYGGGNYDRYLAGLKSEELPRLIGICFATQVEEMVPMEEHDRRLEELMTEQAHIVINIDKVENSEKMSAID